VRADRERRRYQRISQLLKEKYYEKPLEKDASNGMNRPRI